MIVVMISLDALQSILVSAASEHSVHRVLSSIVNGLCDQAEAALARIWLIGEGDICDECALRQECPDQSSCLHLVASAGRSAIDPEEVWDGLAGDYRRFPIGVRKVGRVALNRLPLLLREIKDDRDWIRDTQWAERESIRSFAAQPLVFRGELLGVFAVFCRDGMDEQTLSLLKIFADHAAVAIANARAFEEIDELRHRLSLENEYLRQEVGSARGFGDIIGSSSAILKVQRQVALVAPTDSTVLIVGETGTGKELVAQAIHQHSERAKGPMVRVNCAAIPRDLFESEFYGHVKGAFTGATQDRVGRFELAHRGTIFLDEVGEIPLELQSKLLRVLQEGQLERVGENKTRNVDVRVIAATNRDLKQEATSHRFRQDLYYRLSVFPVEIPPLRDRVEDIPELAAHFLQSACARFRIAPLKLKQKHLLELRSYDWPGNVRELQNVVERAAITARVGGLQFNLSGRAGERVVVNDSVPVDNDILTQTQLRNFERDNILRALERTNGKIAGPGGAAELLGMKPTTLASRVKALGIAWRNT